MTTDKTKKLVDEIVALKHLIKFSLEAKTDYLEKANSYDSAARNMRDTANKYDKQIVTAKRRIKEIREQLPKE